MKHRKDASGAQHNRLVCPFDVKNLDASGSFTGYASVFGNVDLGDDIVERGAFTKIHTTKDNKVRILWQHDMRQPIGKALFKQDDIGLFVDGMLLLDIPKGREAYALMKSQIVDGMSIGYDIMPGGSEMTSFGKRKLTSLELWEASVVTFGMNPLAKIESVKAAHNIKTKREFEDFLREQGFTEGAARSIAAAGFKEQATTQQRDAGDVYLKQLAADIDGLTLGGAQQRDAGVTDVKGLHDLVAGFTL